MTPVDSSPRRCGVVRTRWSSSTRSRSAHPDVFDVLLQVLDEASADRRPGPDRGLPQHDPHPHLEPRGRRDEEQVMDAVKHAFKPEFINRLDDVVIFDPLSEEQLKSIVEIQVRQLAERLAARRLDLQVTEVAKSWLAERGYDPAYGARPLRRLDPEGDRRRAGEEAARR